MLKRPWLFIFLLIFSAFFRPLPALAQNTLPWKDQAQDSFCVATVTVGGKTYDDIPTIQGLECVFFNILQVIVYFAGLSFLIMFILGGYQYLLSSSDPKKVAAASSTLTMSIMGLIGIITSWLILKFIQSFTGI
ncbi:MAG TPA: hypothetical protein VF828_01580, partial [Patescibacteria group bacterium]